MRAAFNNNNPTWRFLSKAKQFSNPDVWLDKHRPTVKCKKLKYSRGIAGDIKNGFWNLTPISYQLNYVKYQ